MHLRRCLSGGKGPRNVSCPPPPPQQQLLRESHPYRHRSPSPSRDPPRWVLAQMPDIMEPRSAGPIRGESGHRAKTRRGGGARGRKGPLAGEQVEVTSGERVRGFAVCRAHRSCGAGLGWGRQLAGAVPLGAMQSSRCRDRPRLDMVTTAEDDPVPHAKAGPPPGIWGRRWGIVACPLPRYTVSGRPEMADGWVG
jgi:hypothetical protein